MAQYTPKTWVTGETIDAAELNALEAAAANAAVLADIGTAGTPTGDGLRAAFAPLGPASGNRPTRPRPSWITTFQPGHGWTGGGFTSLADDTTDYALGTQALKAVTGGTGYSYVDSPTVSVNLTGRYLVALIKVDNIAHLSQLIFYAGNDSGFANQYTWTPIGSTPQGGMPNYWADGEWVLVALSFGQGNLSTGGTPTRSGVVKLRVAPVDDNTGNPVTVHLQAVGTVAESRTTWPNGVVSLSFDDAFAEHYTVARPKLDQYGFAGTLFPIIDALDTSGRLTTAQVKALRDLNGWEIGGHASTSAAHATGLAGMTSAQRVAELATIKQWMRSMGSLSDTFAYPLGSYDAGAITDLRAQFVGARTSFGDETVHATAPPADPFHIQSQNPSGRTLATITGAIDKAYANGEWYVLTFHGITSTGNGSNETATATFNSIIDYLATKGIPVRTVGEVLRAPAP